MMLKMDMLKKQHNKLGLLVSFLLAFGSSTVHAADPNKGAELYRMHCASCHGGPGGHVMPGATDFTRNEAMSPNKGMMRPDMKILGDIKQGKNAMPGYQGVLTDRDILNVIAYMRTLN